MVESDEEAKQNKGAGKGGNMKKGQERWRTGGRASSQESATARRLQLRMLARRFASKARQNRLAQNRLATAMLAQLNMNFRAFAQLALESKPLDDGRPFFQSCAVRSEAPTGTSAPKWRPTSTSLPTCAAADLDTAELGAADWGCPSFIN